MYLWEIDKAFAAIVEKYQHDLHLGRNIANVNGKAMTLGHPIGAIGSMLISTILDELEQQDKQFSLVAMCTAGGIAPAVIIERI